MDVVAKVICSFLYLLYFIFVFIISFEIPHNNREILHKGGPNSPLPRTSSSKSLERKDKNSYRKLLSSKRQLFLQIQNLENILGRVTPEKMWDLATQFREVEILFIDFKTRTNSNISDSKAKAELLEEVDVRFKCCHDLYENAMRNGLGGDPDVENAEAELNAEDSCTPELQLIKMTQCSSKLSTASVENLQRKIELERQHAEISATRKRDLAKAKAAADAAEAAKAKAKVDAEAADAEARFRFKEARLEAEEKIFELSGSELSLLSSRGHHSNYRYPTEPKRVARKDNFNVKNSRTRGRKEAVTVQTPLPQQDTVNAAAASSNSVFEQYLERQGRNDFINLAAQIGYDKRNIAFVFYENQIRKLRSESPCDERKLEVLRASCCGQPREMVNLFLAPMKNMSTSQQIEKAIDHLRQRYGVSGGLTTEPQIIAIRNGSKVIFNATSLKSFHEDLNTLEVFAYTHDEVEKLSGQLLQDVANRLPGVLKRWYLDCLDQRGLNLNRPGFESLRNFVVRELNVMTSIMVKHFLKLTKRKSHLTREELVV